MSPSFFYFDIGNVLLAFNPQRMCQQLADVSGVPIEIVRQVLFAADGAWERRCQYETGQITTADFFARFCEQIGKRPDQARIYEAAADIFTPIDATIDVVTALADRGHRVGLLSNTNAIHWELFTDGRYPVLADPGSRASPFELPIASHFVGAMKPTPRIFEIAIERTGVPAGEIFFIDDRPENVEAARAMGIDAVLYVDAESLCDELQLRGLSVTR